MGVWIVSVDPSGFASVWYCDLVLYDRHGLRSVPAVRLLVFMRKTVNSSICALGLTCVQYIGTIRLCF